MTSAFFQPKPPERFRMLDRRWIDRMRCNHLSKKRGTDMARVLIAGKLHDSGLALFKARPDIDVDYVEEISDTSMKPYLERADAILLRT